MRMMRNTSEGQIEEQLDRKSRFHRILSLQKGSLRYICGVHLPIRMEQVVLQVFSAMAHRGQDGSSSMIAHDECQKVDLLGLVRAAGEHGPGFAINYCAV